MARTGLMQRQFACAVLAVLVSLLSFAGMLQGSRAWWQGQGGSRVDRWADAGSLLAVRLLDTGDAVWKSTQASVQKSIQQTGNEATQVAANDSISNAISHLISARGSESRSEAMPETKSDGLSEAISEPMTPTAGYVPAAELSERPVLLQDLDPVLDLPAPAATPADSAGTADVPESSTVTGILLINRQGNVDRLLFESSGYPRYLEAMLAQRFAVVRFLPGKVDGKPVPSALRITVQLQ